VSQNCCFISWKRPPMCMICVCVCACVCLTLVSSQQQ